MRTRKENLCLDIGYSNAVLTIETPTAKFEGG